MLIKDLSLESPEDNILLDEALWLQAEKNGGEEILRFWESETTFIVLGRIGKEQDDIQVQNALEDKIPVLRRTSGGGTVVQGAGCLNYTFILNKNVNKQLQDLRLSYQWISQLVIRALRIQGCEAVFRPISDIALAGDERKFSGNAQRRGKSFILHHGTVLYKFDLTRISRYLSMPKEIPEYRRQRSHLDFVSNIPISATQFKRDLANLFPAATWQNKLTPSEMLLLDDLKAKFPFQVDIHPQ